MRLRKGIPQVLITVRVSREDSLFIRQMAGRKGFTNVSEYIRSLIGLAQQIEQDAKDWMLTNKGHEGHEPTLTGREQE